MIVKFLLRGLIRQCMKTHNLEIKNIEAREILDSRGNPTVEVELACDFGIFKAQVPSGASRGEREAAELRDGGERYYGKGVLRAVKNVNQIIAPKLKGKDVAKQKEIDRLMIGLDGTKNKSKLGANAIVGVSMACCRAGAASQKIPLWKYINKTYRGRASVCLPKPCFNIINGGVHAGNELDIQEFMVVPQFKKFSENLRIGSEIYHELKKIIKDKYSNLATNIGDEGGFAPPIQVPETAILLILRAAKKLGYQNKVKIALDCAASQFYRQAPLDSKHLTGQGEYRMRTRVFTREGLVRYYLDLIKKYPIFSLEDPFGEEDWLGFQAITQKAGERILIIGDDLLVTNPERIREAHQKKACNGLLLKVNQIGTVSEAIEAAELARSYGWKIMVSHRSGDTCDDFISDLAVGIGADFIKSGAPCRGERVAKYNRLLKIEEELKR